MDNIFKGAIAASGTAVTFLYGEWSALLGILVAFVVFDYLTGVMAGAYEGKLSSQVGFRAIPKKVMIFALVAVAHLVDQSVGDGHIFRDAVIFFYLANELVSIIENAGRVGLPIPDLLTRAVDVLRSKGEK